MLLRDFTTVNKKEKKSRTIFVEPIVGLVVFVSKVYVRFYHRLLTLIGLQWNRKTLFV